MPSHQMIFGILFFGLSICLSVSKSNPRDFDMLGAAICTFVVVPVYVGWHRVITFPSSHCPTARL